MREKNILAVVNNFVAEWSCPEVFDADNININEGEFDNYER